METTGPPKFLGNPGVPTPWSPTPAGPILSGLATDRHGPRYAKDEGYPPCVVFGAQSHGLGTRCLRFAPRGTPTGRQTRFPLSATLYGTGLLTRRVPMKGFHDASYIASSFPKLCLAQLRRHPQTHPRATNFLSFGYFSAVSIWALIKQSF